MFKKICILFLFILINLMGFSNPEKVNENKVTLHYTSDYKDTSKSKKELNTNIEWNKIWDNTETVNQLYGYGDYIYEKSNELGLDPHLVGAIILHETGWGTSEAVIEYNNPGGIMDPNQDWKEIKRFSNLEEGINYTIANLYRLIVNDGLNTVDLIGSVYAPVGAKNDPDGLNKNWVPNVQEIKNKLKGRN